MQHAVMIAVKKNGVLCIAAILLCLVILSLFSHHAFGINYSAGTYGTCTYGSCSITLTTSGSITADVTPAIGSTKCTVSNDVVTATTDSSTGYTVTLNDTDTSNTLSGPVSITANSSTSSSPSLLTANTWGYRVDSIDSFGAGPTSAISSGVIPALTFAGVPISSDTPGLIRTTSTADTGTVNTSVWYGVCANTSLQSGSYNDGVTYTAVIN
ncbi:MAG TPA: hypothetical protein VIM37_01325 [Candidatus Microsaccharimonas sp.]|jgi:hypothetical protein